MSFIVVAWNRKTVSHTHIDRHAQTFIAFIDRQMWHKLAFLVPKYPTELHTETKTKLAKVICMLLKAN